MKFAVLMLAALSLGCAPHRPVKMVWHFSKCAKVEDHWACECTIQHTALNAKTGQWITYCD